VETYDLEFLSHERVGALGKTGSGKTFFMLRLLTQFEGIRVVIVDTKRTIRLAGFKVESKEDRAVKGQKVIYRPAGRTKPRDEFYQKLWNRYGAKRKPQATLYIDEAAHVTSPHRIPQHLELIVQAGREVGMGAWWAGQQSTQINNWLLSQTEKLIVFKLPVESDRKKVAGVVGDAVEDVGAFPDYMFHAYGFPEVEGIQSSDGTETYAMSLDGAGSTSLAEGAKNGGR
jgi:hypothetical protein